MLRGAICVVIAAMVVMSCSLVKAALPIAKPIIRMNYGLRMYHIDTVHVAVRNIIHTFAIDFPAPRELITQVGDDCSLHKTSPQLCNKFSTIVNQTHHLYVNVA